MADKPSKWATLLRGKVPEYTLLLLGTGLTLGLSTVGLRAVFAEQKGEAMQHEVSAVQLNALPPQGKPQSEVIVPAGNFAGTYMGDGETTDKPAQVIGQLCMPALSLTVPIISGITNADLLLGAGHIPGSGNAGGLGNMAVAGHRDTFFRPLRRVEPGMIILVSGRSGTYHYQVDRTEIVTPEQLGILDIGDQPQLTMITCYPFNFVGAAPKRFIVFAHLLSVAPDA